MPSLRTRVASLASAASATFTAAYEAKLNGIQAGATANSSDATLLSRANHTGSQAASTISDFTEASQDVVGAMVAAAGGSYDDAAGTITLPGGGGGTTLTSGATTVDFGTYPGSTDASVAVTGQTGILTGSKVKAWILAEATADHSADEHLVDPPRLAIGPVTAGVGFTIYAFTNNTRRHYGAYTVAWEWS